MSSRSFIRKASEGFLADIKDARVDSSAEAGGTVEYIDFIIKLLSILKGSALRSILHCTK